MTRQRLGMASTPAARAGVCAALLAVALAAGCAGVKVHPRKVLDRSPEDLAAAITPPPSGPLALLETGLARESKDPMAAIAACREAALRSFPLVLREGVATRLEPAGSNGAQATYRRAIEYAILAAHRQSQAEHVPWTEILAREGIAVRGTVSIFPPEMWEEALPSRVFEVEGFRHRAARGGLGAPIVLARHKGEDARPDERYYPDHLFQAATAVLRPGGIGEPPAVLELHDPVRTPAMNWQARAGDSPLPMAYDLTTPLARQFSDAKLKLVGVLGVLFPSEFDGKTGLYMLDPYRPGRIPVVFVHGLMSSPEAWTNAMNDLRGDPELRDKYQFWMFFYSTGNPILASAARFRAALVEAREQLDPQHRDPAFDRMVVMGHSMGGLLSRLSIARSGSTLWDAACKVPPDRLDIDPGLKQKLVNALFFEPTPMVSRVVFVSTPHQGSPMGDELIGRVASSLISLPRTVTDISTALLKSNDAAQLSPIFRDRRQLTSVSQLGEKNPVLKIVGQVPLAPEVPYHSIVGYNGKGSLLAGGDGVVPYRSAHLEGARSELVVLSDHSAQEHAEAILEMRRILLAHLGGGGGDTPASAPTRYALEPSPNDDRPLARAVSNPGLLLVR